MIGGSGALGVRAAFAERDKELAARLAALTATTLPPVADPAQPGRVQRVIIEPNTHRADDESVEHIRQSRLSRWQRQAG